MKSSMTGLCVCAVLGLGCIAHRANAQAPGGDTAHTVIPPNNQIYSLNGAPNIPIQGIGNASVSATGTPNGNATASWNMYLKLAGVNLPVTNAHNNVIITFDATGKWSMPANFNGVVNLGEGTYYADTFATIKIGTQSTSAEDKPIFYIYP